MLRGTSPGTQRTSFQKSDWYICSGSESVLSLWEVLGLLALAESLLLLLELGESSAGSSGRFQSQVLWSVSFLFVFISCSIPSLLVDDGKALGNGPLHDSDFGQLNLWLGRNLRHSQDLELLL